MNKLQLISNSELEKTMIEREGTNLFFENLKWLTSREAVTYLRLPSNGALRNLVYRRKIPYVKLGRSLRFDRLALDRFLESSIERKVA